MKLKWKVGSVPTGRYRSFSNRSWPSAYYGDVARGHLAALITCTDAYHPAAAKTGTHPPLKVYVYDYSLGVVQRKMKVLTREFATLAEAKAATEHFLAQYPQCQPKEETKPSEN